MRLIYLTDRLSDRGGADNHLAQIIDRSVATGHGVTVAFGRDEGGMSLGEEIRRHRFKGLSSRVETSSGIAGLERVLDDADVIHVQNVMNPVVLAMAVDRGRTVVTVQDHRLFCPGRGKTLDDGRPCTTPMAEEVCSSCLPDRAYRRSVMDLTDRRLAALSGAEVVVLSRYMASELAAVGVPEAWVIPPWVEPGPPRAEAGSGFVLGGRLVSHKGAIDGWRAWSEAGRPMPLTVAGSGPVADDLHGTDRVGWLGPDALRKLLRQCRALIFPARWQEPFGILGLEALAQGTPVIVAEAGGTGDWSSRGCLRVPQGDTSAMADAIRRLAGEPGTAMDLGRAGQASVRDRFSAELIGPRLGELYQKVAGC